MSSSPGPDVFSIYLFVCLFFHLPHCHRRRCSSSLSQASSWKILRFRRDCLPRSRYIGCEAPSFLPWVLRSHSQLPRKWSELKFRSSPEVGDTSSKSPRRHFSLPWCTPFVNVKLSGACAELKITYQLYGLSIRNPIHKVRIVEPLHLESFLKIWAQSGQKSIFKDHQTKFGKKNNWMHCTPLHLCELSQSKFHRAGVYLVKNLGWHKERV